jgi:hypothetical protein
VGLVTGPETGRGSRRRIALAGIVLGGIVLAAAVAFLPRTAGETAAGGAGGDGGSTGHHGTASSSTAAEGTSPNDAVGTPLDPGSAVATDLGGSGETSLEQAAAAQVEVERSAETLGPPRAAVAPDEILVGQAETLGGCRPEYGETGQCLPVVPPSMADHYQQMQDAGIDPSTMAHAWTCGELRTYFPEGIVVRVAGVDPDGLDRDGDGLGCGPGDV